MKSEKQYPHGSKLEKKKINQIGEEKCPARAQSLHHHGFKTKTEKKNKGKKICSSAHAETLPHRFVSKAGVAPARAAPQRRPLPAIQSMSQLLEASPSSQNPICRTGKEEKEKKSRREIMKDARKEKKRNCPAMKSGRSRPHHLTLPPSIHKIPEMPVVDVAKAQAARAHCREPPCPAPSFMPPLQLRRRRRRICQPREQQFCLPRPRRRLQPVPPSHVLIDAATALTAS
jgi:hypothetical protein